jgi:hypothetical protein
VLCLVVCAAGAASLCPLHVVAEDVAPEKPPPPPVRHIYDVTDLVIDPSVDVEPSAVLPPTDLLSGPRRVQRSLDGPAQQPLRETETRAERIEQLVKLLKEVIDSYASIKAYETRLIVTASAEDHDKIVEYLADLRKSQERAVRIRATWAALSEDELRAVLVPADKSEGRSAVRIVDVAAVERIDAAIRYRGEINCLNGQRVNLSAGRARSVLSDVEANVGTDAAAMAPVIDLVLSGALLNVLPVVSADGSTATLNLRAVTGRWDKSDAPPIKLALPVAGSQPSVKPPPAPPPLGTMDLERLNMPVHLVATTVKVPTGVAAIVGGMTADAEPQHADDRRPVYLIMEVWAEGASQSRNQDDLGGGRPGAPPSVSSARGAPAVTQARKS